MSKISTPAEDRIIDIIINKIISDSDNFSFEEFLIISEKIIKRQSRRYERIRLNKLCKTDIDQGFDSKNFPHITQFGN